MKTTVTKFVSADRTMQPSLRESIRRVSAVGVAALLMLTVAGCSDSTVSPTDSTSSPDGSSSVSPAKLVDSPYAEIPQSLVEAAKKEKGEVLWYESAQEVQVQPLIKAFTEKYPFAKVKHVTLLGTDVSSRVLQETAAGAATADIATSGASTIFALNEQGVLSSVDWITAGIPKQLVNNDYSILQIGQPYGIVYNPELVTGEDIPSTWEDLLDPKWKDKKICTWLHATPLANLVTVWGPSKTQDFVNKLVDQRPAVLPSSKCAQDIGAGIEPIGIDNAQNFKRAQVAGAPVAMIFPDPASLDLLVSTIPKNAANPETAKLFLSWLATKEGSDLYEKDVFRGNPLLPDSAAHKLLSGLKLAAWPLEESAEYLTWVDKFTKQLQGVQ